ncbi:MAG: monofunctional biosynthetic peptidoglycan transglycosylase [Thermodesulfobacteriota bacterium]
MVKKIILLLFLGFILYLASLFIFPNVSQLKKENPKKTSFMEFREREGEAKGKKVPLRQQWVPLARISPYLIKAVIIAEDDKFWAHEGFDFEAIQKAIEKDLKARKFKVGGSTISQQLAKNLYLTPSKNLLRKVKEAILTWRIERTLSKRRIIELYLNVVEWGNGIYGAEAAARRYFGKSAAALGPDEAARMAVVLPNPRKWNPAGQSSYIAKRARVIISIMLKRGIIIPIYEEIINPAQEGLKGESGEPVFQENKENQPDNQNVEAPSLTDTSQNLDSKF